MEHESATCHELKEEKGDLKLALEEKNMSKAELEKERISSQEEMDELWSNLKLALTEKDETKKRADDDMERLQDAVQLFKVMKYKEGYHDGAQDKSPRYPLGDEDEVLVQKTFKIPAKAPAISANTSNMVEGAKVRGGGTEPDSQVESSRELHVRVI